MQIYVDVGGFSLENALFGLVVQGPLLSSLKKQSQEGIEG